MHNLRKAFHFYRIYNIYIGISLSCFNLIDNSFFKIRWEIAQEITGKSPENTDFTGKFDIKRKFSFFMVRFVVKICCKNANIASRNTSFHKFMWSNLWSAHNLTPDLHSVEPVSQIMHICEKFVVFILRLC